MPILMHTLTLSLHKEAIVAVGVDLYCVFKSGKKVRHPQSLRWVRLHHHSHHCCQLPHLNPRRHHSGSLCFTWRSCAKHSWVFPGFFQLVCLENMDWRRPKSLNQKAEILDVDWDQYFKKQNTLRKIRLNFFQGYGIGFLLYWDKNK